MAQSKRNVITHGLSGKVGDIVVFRQRGGKTFVCNVPKENEKPPTKEQLLIRQRFQEGVIYGKTAIKDPVIRDIYAAKAKDGQTAFNVAVSDFFNAPSISNVDVSNYQGKPGDTIKARVIDGVIVKSVEVKIENGDGSLLEEGNAIVEPNGLDYVYTATASNPTVPGTKITISASGLPDNITVSETILP